VIPTRGEVQTLFTLFNLIFNAKSCVIVDPSEFRALGVRILGLQDVGEDRA
jgi:hypothetical protein